MYADRETRPRPARRAPYPRAPFLCRKVHCQRPFGWRGLGRAPPRPGGSRPRAGHSRDRGAPRSSTEGGLRPGRRLLPGPVRSARGAAAGRARRRGGPRRARPRRDRAGGTPRAPGVPAPCPGGDRRDRNRDRAHARRPGGDRAAAPAARLGAGRPGRHARAYAPRGSPAARGVSRRGALVPGSARTDLARGSHQPGPALRPQPRAARADPVSRNALQPARAPDPRALGGPVVGRGVDAGAGGETACTCRPAWAATPSRPSRAMSSAMRRQRLPVLPFAARSRARAVSPA